MEEGWEFRELQGVNLGDRRRVKTAASVLSLTYQNPTVSLSASLGGKRQAAGDLFQHKLVNPGSLMAGHYMATRERCTEHEVVLVAQDTTYFVYKQPHIKDLGPVNGSSKSLGLMAHSACALSEEGCPLGIASLAFWGKASEELPEPEDRDENERESSRWRDTMDHVAQVMPKTSQVIVIADREGDTYGLLAAKRDANVHFLIRLCQNRRAITCADDPSEAEAKRLKTIVAEAPVLGIHSVIIPRKSASPKEKAAKARTARLEMRAARVKVQRPAIRAVDRELEAKNPKPKEVEVTVIQALEIEAPEGETPICWMLLTDLVVEDLETAALQVTRYTRRWEIERLHYTLKSGLNSERLQIDDANSLANCLSLYYIVAWRLLHMTHLSRIAPETPAAEVFDEDEIAVLQAKSQKKIETVGQAVKEVARPAGHEYYRKGRPPGVKRLWMGLHLLGLMAEGWRLAREMYRAAETEK